VDDEEELMSCTAVERVVLSIVALVASCTRFPAGHAGVTLAGDERTLSRQVDSVADAAQRTLTFPGLTVAIMRGNTMVLAKGYGFADRAAHIPATPQTVFPIGSITKHITAAAVMRLVEQGRLRLDAPLSTYLPTLDASSARAVTIRQLLNQTSGIPEFTDFPDVGAGFENGDPHMYTLAAMTRRIGRSALLFDAGTWWAYSNSNYTLLSSVIESVSGQSYEDYLRRELFTPIGLSAIRPCFPDLPPPAAPRALGYDRAGDSVVVTPFPLNLATSASGAGELCSDVVSLATWMRKLVTGAVVGATSYREMITPMPVTAGYTPTYGFGLATTDIADQRAISHSGVAPGATSMVAYFPTQDVTIAVLSNGPRAIHHVMKGLARATLGLPPLVLRKLPVTADEIDRITGTYDTYGFRVLVFADSGRLFTRIMGGRALPLYSQGGGEFATDEPQGNRIWFTPSTGRARRIIIEWFETRSFGFRVP
jgi:CubicO group peptidase (beta-lactamase class C family)